MYRVYPFPFDEVEKNSNVILFGGGIVGEQFANQIVYSGHCNCLFIADSNHSQIQQVAGIAVRCPEQIQYCEYDKIVIASTRYCDEIYEFLLDLNVPSEKIVNKITCHVGRNDFKKYPTLFPPIFHLDWNRNIFDSNPRQSLMTDYDALTRNLDKDSIKTIDKIIYRTQTLERYSDAINYYDLWTNAELDEIRETFFLDGVDWCLRNVVKLRNDCYTYDGYRLPVKHFTYSVYKFKHGIEQLKSLEKLKSLDFIDAGAAYGDSASVLSPYTNGKIHSFEPMTEHFEQLLKTIALNGLSNIIPMRCAVGANADLLPMRGAKVSSRESINPDDAKYVTSISLDEYVKKNMLRVGFIKTDLEGYERNFLLGAENTIRQQRPALSISIYHNYDDFFTIKPLIESWDLGYTFRVLKPLDGRILAETILLAEVL